MRGILRRLLSSPLCRLGYHRWQSCIEGYTCSWCGLVATWEEIFPVLDEMLAEKANERGS